ncbi:hypothetical protein [Dyella sp. Tek66A03]|uniref:hypothetical protein n=1 Tax=Dyella sp. Tek66A03 TaxID=3458298 RepID=UPI00403E8EB9
MPSPDLTLLLALLRVLDPATLDASAAASVREFLVEAASADTTRSYASALRYRAPWFKGRYRAPFTSPVSEAVVMQSAVDCWAGRGKTGLTWELLSAPDATLVDGGYKQKLGA